MTTSEPYHDRWGPGPRPSARPGRRAVLRGLAAAAALPAAGCGSDGGGSGGGGSGGGGSGGGAHRTAPSSREPSGRDSPRPSGAPASPAPHLDVETVATGIPVPWGLVLLPDRDLLVSCRDTGRIVRVPHGGGAPSAVGTVPGTASAVREGGEAGLLGLALSPHFGRDHLVYAYQSTRSHNRIVRMVYDGGRPPGRRLGRPRTVLGGIPRATHHDGGRIAFGPDGLLYAGTGDAQHPDDAQEKSSLAGKILRITADGRPAPGNPFPGSPVYSYGHRNVQGLAWDPSGRLWSAEFGDHQADELNLIRPGRNYGWPATQGRTRDRRYTGPVAQWGTAEDSPSGIAYADGAIWMAALRGERLWRIPLRGARAAAAPQPLLKGRYGRLRTVVADRDGTLLLTTSNRDGRGSPHGGDDRVLRVTPR